MIKRKTITVFPEQTIQKVNIGKYSFYHPGLENTCWIHVNDSTGFVHLTYTPCNGTWQKSVDLELHEFLSVEELHVFVEGEIVYLFSRDYESVSRLTVDTNGDLVLKEAHLLYSKTGPTNKHRKLDRYIQEHIDHMDWRNEDMW